MVVDASAVIGWVFEEGDWPATFDTLIGEETVLLAPWLWALEVTNVVLVKERRGMITVAQGTRILELLDDLGVQRVPDSPGRPLSALAQLARPYQLTAYDAAYLNLAIGQDLPLLTCDQNLCDAARRVGVALVWDPLADSEQSDP
jgi:predicted nucleic acid-binding protein